MSLRNIIDTQKTARLAYWVSVSRWREGRVWRTWNETWGAEGGSQHTECLYRRFGPIVIHRYTVDPGYTRKRTGA